MKKTQYIVIALFSIMTSGIVISCSDNSNKFKPTLVKCFDINDLPVSKSGLKAKKLFNQLSREQKELLASTIVNSANWKKALIHYEDSLKNREKSLTPDEDSLKGPVLEHNYYWYMRILAAIRKISSDNNIKFLLDTIGDTNYNYLDYLDLFKIVVNYYILQHPDDKNGWDFLWFYMGMEEEEYRYFTDICNLITQENLTKFKYGQKIMERVKTKNPLFNRQDPL